MLWKAANFQQILGRKELCSRSRLYCKQLCLLGHLAWKGLWNWRYLRWEKMPCFYRKPQWDNYNLEQGCSIYSKELSPFEKLLLGWALVEMELKLTSKSNWVPKREQILSFSQPQPRSIISILPHRLIRSKYFIILQFLIFSDLCLFSLPRIQQILSESYCTAVLSWVLLAKSCCPQTSRAAWWLSWSMLGRAPA